MAAGTRRSAAGARGGNVMSHENGSIQHAASAPASIDERERAVKDARAALKTEKAALKLERARLAELADPDWPPQKTAWRGVLHQHAALAALTAGIMLIVSAPGWRAKAGCAVYAGALFTQLGCSALYHVPAWSRTTRTWLRRLDHAAIFTLIAGTYTPLCLLALDQGTARLLLAIEWGAAAVGMLQTLFWVNAPKQLKTVMYIFLGWVVLPWAGQMKSALGATGAWLIAAGGVAYTLGGLCYAMRWPNPWPRTFGYHEIFHAATILASILHFTAVYRMVHYPGVPP